MSDPELISDHVQRALQNLTSEFSQAEKVRALVSIFTQEVQELEDVFYALIVERLLSASFGAQLDAWGKIVGESRLGLSDNDYRNFIRARIIANLSEGTIENIVEVASIVADASSVRYYPNHPAAFTLVIIRDSLLSDALRSRIAALIGLIRPAGVGVDLLITGTPTPFRMDSGPGFDVGQLIGSL